MLTEVHSMLPNKVGTVHWQQIEIHTYIVVCKDRPDFVLIAATNYNCYNYANLTER